MTDDAPKGQDSTEHKSRKPENSSTKIDAPITQTNNHSSYSQHHPCCKSEPAKWWHRIDWSQVVLDALLLIVGIGLACIYTGQLNQMVESNAINRENMESVQRALVFFNGNLGMVKRGEGKKTNMFTLVTPWENTGVTPAMSGKSVVNWKTTAAPEGLPDGFTFSDQVEIQPRQFEIPPKGSGNGTMDVPVLWIKAVQSKKTRLFIFGWITYDDIFKGRLGERKTPRHLAEFCDEVVNIKSTPEDVTNPDANIRVELSLCTEHNCSDERCSDYDQMKIR
jgi:hypothetical protein